MTLKILIVDDSRLSRMMAAHYIQTLRPNIEIHEAPDGASAIKLLDCNDIDIGIVDMNMPGLSGLDLIEAIQQMRPAMRLALLTANTQEGMRQRAQNLHVHFFGKPITEAVISDILSALAPV